MLPLTCHVFNVFSINYLNGLTDRENYCKVHYFAHSQYNHHWKTQKINIKSEQAALNVSKIINFTKSFSKEHFLNANIRCVLVFVLERGNMDKKS